MAAVGKTGKEWRKVDPVEVEEWRRLVVEERKTYREVGRQFGRGHKIIQYHIRERQPGGSIIKHRPGLKRNRKSLPPSVDRTLIKLLTAARGRSRSCKAIEFSMTLPDARALYEQQQGLCALTGLSMDLHSRTGQKGPRNPLVMSIDRIDSSCGYVVENVRLVVWAANAAMNVWGEEVFAKIAEAYIRHRDGKIAGVDRA